MQQDALVTLGRSDAMLAARIIKSILNSDDKDYLEASYRQEAEDLYQFIMVQLDSIASSEVEVFNSLDFGG